MIPVSGFTYLASLIYLILVTVFVYTMCVDAHLRDRSFWLRAGFRALKLGGLLAVLAIVVQAFS